MLEIIEHVLAPLLWLCVPSLSQRLLFRSSVVGLVGGWVGFVLCGEIDDEANLSLNWNWN